MPTAEQRFVSFPNKYGPYDKLDEQLHRWTMEKLQNQQIEIQLYQCRLLQQIIALDIVNSWD